MASKVDARAVSGMALRHSDVRDSCVPTVLGSEESRLDQRIAGKDGFIRARCARSSVDGVYCS